MLKCVLTLDLSLYFSAKREIIIACVKSVKIKNPSLLHEIKMSDCLDKNRFHFVISSITHSSNVLFLGFIIKNFLPDNDKIDI